MLAKIKLRLKDMHTLRQLFLKAEVCARAEGVTEPGSEHLVMAALTLPDQTAQRAFHRLGVNPLRFTSAVTQQYADALTRIGVNVGTHLMSDPLPNTADGPFKSKPSAQSLIKKLAQEKPFGASQPLLGADVVLAALANDIGTVGRALAVLRIAPRHLAEACQLEIDAYDRVS